MDADTRSAQCAVADLLRDEIAMSAGNRYPLYFATLVSRRGLHSLMLYPEHDGCLRLQVTADLDDSEFPELHAQDPERLVLYASDELELPQSGGALVRLSGYFVYPARFC